MARIEGSERGAVFKITVITVFLLLFSMVMLLCLEGGLRFYYRDVLSTADGTSYFSLRNFHLFQDEHNGWRFRGKHFEEAPDERYRLVVAGDSFTWGQGVYPASERFTERVEVSLNKTENASAVEVVNVGICGFNLPNHYKFLHFIDAIKPDYVLYQWFTNDMVLKPDRAQYKTAHLISNRAVHTWFWKHSALYYLLQRGYGSMQRNDGTKKSYTQYLIDSMSDPESKQVVKARGLLERLIDHHKKNNTDFGIVLFPSFAGPMDQYKLGFLHEQVVEVCAEKEIECLDLRSNYSGVEHKKLWANEFDPHPSALAHEMAADAIYDFFGSTWKEAAQKKGMQKQMDNEKDSKTTSEKK
jgi:GDSL-like Lipase/Acylhydrolase family